VDAPHVIDEHALAAHHRRQAGELLAAEWGEDWRGDAYAGPYAPQFRVLALDADGAVAGHVSAFAIPTSPARALYGIGDLVVRGDARGAGVARAICDAVVRECWRRGAETILVDTVAARNIFTRLGFEPVVTFRFFYQDGNSCSRRPHWMAADRAPGSGPVELLAHWDF
jgi:GNAT superfamily N-acetyltransferase